MTVFIMFTFLFWLLSYLNIALQAICKTAKEIAKPIIAENTAKYKIDSVEFETLTLGSLPPTLQGQCYSHGYLAFFTLDYMLSLISHSLSRYHQEIFHIIWTK